MDLICKKCGCPITEGTKYCSSCGIKLEIIDTNEITVDIFSHTGDEIPQQQPLTTEDTVTEDLTAVADRDEQMNSKITLEQPINITPEIEPVSPGKSPKKSAKKIIKIIALFLILALILTSVGVMLFNYYSDRSDINAAISDYVDAVYLGKYNNADDMIPESFLEGEINKEYYNLIIENYDPKDLAEQRSKDLDEYFGEDIVIKVDITKLNYISNDSKLVYSDIFRLSNGSEFEFENLYRTEFEVTVVGSKAEKTFTHYLYAMEFDGEWYLFDIRYSYFTIIDVYVDYLEIDALFEDDEEVYF